MLQMINRPLLLFRNIRGITTNIKLNTDNPTSSNIGKNDKNRFASSMHHTTAFDKRILVWAKKYPKVENVPKLVSLDVMHAATSRLRIRVANYMMLISAIAFLVTILQGEDKKKNKLAEMKILQDETRREIISNMRETK